MSPPKSAAVVQSMSLLREELQTLPSRRLLAGILWRLLLPLSITWAWQLFSRASDATVGPIRTFFDAIAFFLIPATLIIAAKLYLFERYSRRHRYYRLLEESQRTVSLPSISACVDELFARITSRTLLHEPRVIALKADWGNGKSTVLRELQERFLQQPHSDDTDDEEIQTVMIMADIWSFSNHLDLQFALLEELLSHPLVPAPVLRRWPFSLRFWNHDVTLIPLIFLRFLLSTGKFVLKTSNVDFAVQQTEGLWYHLLRNIVDKLRSHNIRVVWCLDEIDRSSPEVAQQAILLTKRFLNFPGTTIVLPFVETTMQWKVFNPLLCTQLDLHSTMEQILIDKKELFSSVLDLIEPPIKQRYFYAPEEAEGTSQDVSARLTRMASRLHDREFRILATLASEKFLQQCTLTLPYPTPKDICVLLNKTDRIITQECRTTLLQQNPVFKEEDVEKAIQSLRKSSNRLSPKTASGLRQFISRAEHIITALCMMQRDKKINQTGEFWQERILEGMSFACVYSDQDSIKP